ncbi:MAG: Gldg family protein [Candidatus Electryonea clarkiae]|nr:Gldg family protein [Candidatus Electryonea clarkiae]
MKRKDINLTASILLIVIVLILVNMIANTKFFRIDLTAGKVFTLSKASKSVVSNLEDPVTVKVFASKNLSPQLNDVKRFLNDLLSGYDAYGKGNFHYEFIDPGTDEELEKEAQDYKIPPFQENVWNKDQLELKRVYLGAVFLYGADQEVMQTIQSTAGLEYNITSIIKRITAQQDMKIGYLTGHGESSPFEDMKQANSILESNYKITTIDLSMEDEIPPDVNTLLIITPQTEIPDADKLKIDQYLMKGGTIGWFYNKVHADLQNGQANQLPLKIDAWTQGYGFRVNDDIVADMKSGMINIQERRGFFTIQNTVNYYFFPVLNAFNKNHEITQNIEVIATFFPSSIDTTSPGHGVTITPLMFSSDKALVETGQYNINAMRKFVPAEFDRAGIPLAAALEGSFTSYFASREIPVDEDGEPMMAKDNVIQQSPDSTRMLVVGEGNFLKDQFLTNPANIFLLLNAVDWLVGDTELINLRTREVVMRPLKDLSTGQKQVWKYFNWFLPPILVIVLGIVYWQIRRNTRKQGLGA